MTAPHSLSDLSVELQRLTIRKDDYLVITVNEPKHFTQSQARQLSEYVHRSLPQLAGRIIIKAADIEIEVAPREEAVANANIPPWLR